jgi:DMSO/TMAO reductase YedYZ heme-binding membrane subunit
VVAVEVTSLMMRSLGRRLWHAIHLLSLVVFVSITVHALVAGADAQEPALRAFAIASSTAVAGLCAVRVAARRAPRQSAPAAVTR